MPAISPSIPLSISRTRVAGVLLFGMIVLSVLWGFYPDSLITLHWVAGVFAVTAAIFLVIDVSFAQRIQVGLLLLIGAFLLWFGSQRGIAVDLPDVISRNTGLLSMILSVGFLRLVVVNDYGRVSELPVGKKAYLHTLLGLGVFGSVINISAPIVICDRLAMQAPTDLFTARSITRVFSACAAWSPYFAGAAVVLTYVEGVHLFQVMVTGFPFLVVAVIAVFGFSLYYDSERVDQFRGYPVSLSSLLIPALLTLLVILLQQLIPDVSILVAIALSSLLLTIGTLLNRHGVAQGAARFIDYITTGLPKTVSELLLFLAAGVLAAGLTALVAAGTVSLALNQFTVVTASLLLAGMIFIAAMGIHPVIQISGLTPLVLPVNPDPDLLAITYLFAWSLGTCASPLSGTHLIFQGRYGIPAWRGATQNWGYVVLMYCVAVGLLKLHTVFS